MTTAKPWAICMTAFPSPKTRPRAARGTTLATIDWIAVR